MAVGFSTRSLAHFLSPGVSEDVIVDIGLREVSFRFFLSVILVTSCILFSFLLTTIYGALPRQKQISLRLVRNRPPHYVGFVLQRASSVS
jgi:hypothetical protein